LDRAQVTRGCLIGLPGIVDNAFVLECAAGSAGRLVPIAGVDPCGVDAGSSIVRQMNAFTAAGFRGIKLHPRLGGYDPLDGRVGEAIHAASDAGLVVFIDTLFRQRGRRTGSAVDIIESLAIQCPAATMILLHGGGVELFEVAQVVRLHSNLVLDLSYTLLEFSGSSVELDLAWVLGHLDRRVVIGSDMPEFTPDQVFGRLDELMRDLPEIKRTNVAYGNLERLFAADAAPAGS
jgi:predicted TIM-barrel fold metal-dependent hydrolase